MKYTEMQQGRIFVLSLEPGEIIREEVERFSEKQNIRYATVSVVGGVDKGSRLIVGPKYPVDEVIEPLVYDLDAPNEVVGFGTLFPDSFGKPVLHMHGTAGRDGKSVTGCFRDGVIAWFVTEVVITELVGTGPVRKTDKESELDIMTIE